MQTVNVQTIESLKVAGHYFTAGALAAELGTAPHYGCHTGMRSSLDYARRQFAAGYAAAKAQIAALQD